MFSRQMGDDRKVRYVEQCSRCLWIDEASLDWWAEDAVKNAMPKQAQRIAVAAGTEPFAFVQSPHEELTLDEILVQALAAAQTQGILQGPVNASDGQRMSAILKALRAEVMRFQRLAEGRAIRAVRKRVIDRSINIENGEPTLNDIIELIR
jgi:hypothetical protein